MDDPGRQFIPRLEGDQLNALIEVMYLVGFADGVFGELEKQHFRAALDALTDGRASEEVLDTAVERVAADSEAHGIGGCIERLAQRLNTPQLREIALILASDVAAIDGILHPKEEQLLRQLAQGFSLSAGATHDALDGFAAPSSA